MLPRWLWRLLPALTVALLGLLVASGPASAFQPHHAPTFTAYVYDHPDGSDILAGATTERGPPTTYDRDTTHVADDQWSSGASAYSDGPIPPAAIDDDHPDVLAQLVRATATTDASSIAFHRSRVAAETGAAAERTTAVIGRQADTAVAKDWAGHEVLDLPAKEWSIARNDQWVQSVVDRKMPVYVGSPTTWPNLWDAAAGRSTVFGRELQQFTKAGYTWDGWTMIPPGG